MVNRYTREICAVMLNALEKQCTREGGSETVRLRTRRSVCVLRGFSRVQLFVAPRAPSASLVQGVFLARILEWVTISSSRASSQPRDRI